MTAACRTTVRYPSMRERILANVKIVPARSWGMDTPCWEWQGTKNARGYGHISMRRPERRKPWPYKVLVHRLVLEVWRGIPLESVETAMHRCSNKACCNPSHIDPGTDAENREHYYAVERLRQPASQPASQPAERARTRQR